ncbi:MAG: cbb3-type cytochrome oxidase assembly protein CcoS [Burkholderiaceae bacterium]|nr:cbb3-type cytochrome oxidase assembly protein CcoS [Burkholderiaceae bacterium]
MEALYLLVPLSVILVFLAIWIFFGMSDSGQFDDMEGPAMRILLDDEDVLPPADKNVKSNSHP